jgi:hypothetical protein
MGIIPGEATNSDLAKIEEEKKKRRPKTGDFAYISIRGKIVSISNSMCQIELSELHEAGVLVEPIFMWIPTHAISSNQLESQVNA